MVRRRPWYLDAPANLTSTRHAYHMNSRNLKIVDCVVRVFSKVLALWHVLGAEHPAFAFHHTVVMVVSWRKIKMKLKIN